MARRMAGGPAKLRSVRHLTRDELAAGLDHIAQSPADGGRVGAHRPPAPAGRAGGGGRGRASTSTTAWWATAGGPGQHPHDDGEAHPDMQLNLMNARVAALVAVDPDRWALAGDQLYVDLDLSVANLPPGTRLALGSAVIEITDQPHRGCAKFSAPLRPRRPPLRQLRRRPNDAPPRHQRPRRRRRHRPRRRPGREAPSHPQDHSPHQPARLVHAPAKRRGRSSLARPATGGLRSGSVALGGGRVEDTAGVGTSERWSQASAARRRRPWWPHSAFLGWRGSSGGTSARLPRPSTRDQFCLVLRAWQCPQSRSSRSSTVKWVRDQSRRWS